MTQKERVAVFIDGSNFYHSTKRNIGNVDIDFQKFGEIVSNGRELVGIFYYNAPLDRTHDLEKYKKQQKFFEGLKKIPKFNLILVRLQKRKIGKEIIYAVKGDDIHLAVDMIMLAVKNFYDIGVIVSGDGDFVPVVEAVKTFNKKIENYYFKIGQSWHLRQICNKSVLMDKKSLKECIIEKEIPPKRINKKNKK